MVMELKKYRMNVVGISETKWFGSAVYKVDGYVILHSVDLYLLMVIKP